MNYALTTGIVALVTAVIVTGINPLTSLQQFMTPQQVAQTVQTAPKVEPVEVETLPPPPLPKPKPTAVEKPKPKPKPKTPLKIAERPGYCSDLDKGISYIGKEGVRREARRRGKTETQIADAERACGY